MKKSLLHTIIREEVKAALGEASNSELDKFVNNFVLLYIYNIQKSLTNAKLKCKIFNIFFRNLIHNNPFRLLMKYSLQ